MRLSYKVPLLLSNRLGANVLANGTFDTVITGWSAAGTPINSTPSVVSGRAFVDSDSNGDGMGQVVTLVLNARYRLQFDYEVVSGGLNVSKVGMTSVAGLTGSGTHVLIFTETDGTARNLLFQCNAAGQFYADNIRLQRIL
jgi:hypothetical protein